jgi:hypothetical protein
MGMSIEEMARKQAEMASAETSSTTPSNVNKIPVNVAGVYEFSDADYDAIRTVEDEKVAPNKTEAIVSITEFTTDDNGMYIRYDKNSLPFVMCRLKIIKFTMNPSEDIEDYKNISFMLYVPAPPAYATIQQGEVKLKQKSRAWNKFMSAFKIANWKMTDFTKWEGLMATAILGRDDSEDYGTQNKISKWVASN